MFSDPATDALHIEKDLFSPSCPLFLHGFDEYTDCIYLSHPFHQVVSGRGDPADTSRGGRDCALRSGVVATPLALPHESDPVGTFHHVGTPCVEVDAVGGDFGVVLRRCRMDQV